MNLLDKIKSNITFGLTVERLDKEHFEIIFTIMRTGGEILAGNKIVHSMDDIRQVFDAAVVLFADQIMEKEKEDILMTHKKDNAEGLLNKELEKLKNKKWN